MSNRLASFFPQEEQTKQQPKVEPQVSTEADKLDHEIQVLGLETGIAFVAVEQAEEDVAELVEIATGLEALAEQAQASLEHGGLNREAAALLGIAADAQTARLGFEQSVIPAVESFGTESEALTATQVAVESAKETIDRVVKAVRTAVMKVIEMAKQWWKKAVEMLPKKRAKAEAMIKMLDDLGEMKEQEFKLSAGVGAKLAIDGKVGSFADVKKAMDEVMKFYGKDFGATYKPVVDAIEKALDVKEDVTKEQADAAFMEVLKAAREANTARVNALKGVKLPAGKMVASVKDDDTGRLYVSLDTDSEAKKPADADLTVKTMSTGDMESVLKYVKETADDLVEARKANDDLAKMIQDAVKKAEGAAKDVDNAVYNSHVQNVIRRLNNVSGITGAGTLGVYSYVGSTIDALVSMCEASMKQYDKK